jgi:hypothetical protein
MTHSCSREPEDHRDTLTQSRNASPQATLRDGFWIKAERDGTRFPDKATAIERENLRQRVRLFLASSNIPTLRHVDVEVGGDAVLLQGKVRSYYEKQMALQFAARVAGVIRVIDLIQVHTYVPSAKMRRVNPPNTREAAQASYVRPRE